jgi:apolipoprotein N-acyltransferase
LAIAQGIRRAAGWLILAYGAKRAFAALAAGAVTALAMPPFDFFWVAFLTFPVLVFLLDGAAADPASGPLSKGWKAFATGWCFGFGYFSAGLWWTAAALFVEGGRFAIFLPLALFGLPAVLAVFHGLGAAIARPFWRDDWRRIAALAMGLGGAEYLRGHVFTGFPWNAFGYAAMPSPLAMQSASLIGLYGVGLLAVAVFAAPALLAGRRERGAVVFGGLCVLLAAGHVGHGVWRLSTHGQEFADGVRLRLVQPAIDQSEKWSPEAEDRNFALLLQLSTAAPSLAGQGLEGETRSGLDGVTHLIWPESSFPFVLTQRPDALAALDGLLGESTYLVAGALRVEPPAAGETRERVFNSVFLISPQGEIEAASDKVHLVPFGEYLPMQELAESIGLEQLTHLRGGFSAGNARPLIDTGAAGRLLALICYEIIFPGEAAASEGSRPDWLVNVTNDAWFGATPGPWQHWRQAVVRGVETGLPVVRSANDGISSVTDAFGRNVAMIGHGERATIDSLLPLPAAPTPYSRFGDLFFFLLIAGCFFAVISGAKRRENPRH